MTQNTDAKKTQLHPTAILSQKCYQLHHSTSKHSAICSHLAACHLFMNHVNRNLVGLLAKNGSAIKFCRNERPNRRDSINAPSHWNFHTGRYHYDHLERKQMLRREDLCWPQKQQFSLNSGHKKIEERPLLKFRKNLARKKLLWTPNHDASTETTLLLDLPEHKPHRKTTYNRKRTEQLKARKKPTQNILHLQCLRSTGT